MTALTTWKTKGLTKGLTTTDTVVTDLAYKKFATAPINMSAHCSRENDKAALDY